MRGRFAVLFLLLSVAAAAQQSNPGTWKYGASIRSRAAIWNWFEGDANNSYAYSGNQLRFNFGQSRETVDWAIDLAAPFVLGAPDDAGAPAPQGGLGLGANYFGANKRNRNSVMAFPKQAFINLKGLGGGDHAVKLGRFDFADMA